MSGGKLYIETARDILRDLIMSATDQKQIAKLSLLVDLIEEAFRHTVPSRPNTLRNEKRFNHLTATTLIDAAGVRVECGISDISSGGALVFLGDTPVSSVGDSFELLVPWLSALVRCKVRGALEGALHVQFIDLSERERLTLEKALDADVHP
jgi:hypothetical protein